MAFSIFALCRRSGQVGVAVCGTRIAVGARIGVCAAGVGAVLVQFRPEPRLAEQGLALLRSGKDAAGALKALVAADPHANWRQIAILDAAGGTAVFSGQRTQPEMSEAPTQDACAIGNRLASSVVPAAMLQGWQAEPALPLAERLLRALEEGQRAGGGQAPGRSALLRVAHAPGLNLVDLRVDWHEAPVAELRALWDRHRPLANDLLLRGIDPDNPAVRP